MSDAIAAVVGGAQLLLPVREAAGLGPNRGRFVEAILAVTGAPPGSPWCAAFVAYVGRGLLGRQWPLPPTASCDVLLETARKKGWLVEARPEPGDLFLVLHTDTDAVHTGFVSRVDAAGRFGTIEGNSNDGGSREGDGVYARLRGGGADHARYAFVRWARALDASAAPAPEVA